MANFKPLAIKYHDIFTLYISEENADVWIGGTDEHMEGDWIWATSGRPIDDLFSDWSTAFNGQPDNSGGDQDCLKFSRASSSHNGKWNDYDCFSSSMYFCEYRYP